ncbi:cupin domain-containing protein [Planotetraspora sp. GP83]|uniref:cupin domain-containing protein n=1 Tax=Planotetraspora sp. GP83 TaxID=3156264 RepID=UPI003513C7B7
MSNASYPEFFHKLSKPDVPMDGLKAWMMSDKIQVIFYELPEGSKAGEHTHGAEWGIIVDGAISITMNGETTTYGKGDTYFIPAGVPHSVVNHPGVVGIDVFEEPDRFPAAKD